MALPFDPATEIELKESNLDRLDRQTGVPRDGVHSDGGWSECGEDGFRDFFRRKVGCRGFGWGWFGGRWLYGQRIVILAFFEA
jgi:hypothetical protein